MLVKGRADPTSCEMHSVTQHPGVRRGSSPAPKELTTLLARLNFSFSTSPDSLHLANRVLCSSQWFSHSPLGGQRYIPNHRPMVREIDAILELVRKYSIAVDLPFNMIHASHFVELIELRSTVMFSR